MQLLHRIDNNIAPFSLPIETDEDKATLFVTRLITPRWDVGCGDIASPGNYVDTTRYSANVVDCGLGRPFS
jgi:hypothetical protein